MNRYKLLFWDFDGVIKESIEVKSRAFFRLFEPFGLSLAKKVREHHELNGGMSRFEKFPIYLKWAGMEVNQSIVNDYCDRFSRQVVQDVIDSPWVAGVEHYLHDNLYKQIFILVSATPQEELELILCALNLAECFERIYGAPMAKRDAINATVSDRQIDPGHCLMIGDAKADLDAATANEVPFLLRRHSSNANVFQAYTGPSIEDFRSK